MHACIDACASAANHPVLIGSLHACNAVPCSILLSLSSDTPAGAAPALKLSAPKTCQGMQLFLRKALGTAYTGLRDGQIVVTACTSSAAQLQAQFYVSAIAVSGYGKARFMEVVSSRLGLSGSLLGALDASGLVNTAAGCRVRSSVSNPDARCFTDAQRVVNQQAGCYVAKSPPPWPPGTKCEPAPQHCMPRALPSPRYSHAGLFVVVAVVALRGRQQAHICTTRVCMALRLKHCRHSTCTLCAHGLHMWLPMLPPPPRLPRALRVRS